VEAPVPEGAAGGAVAGDTAAAAPSDSSAASAATAFTAPDESDDEPSAALPLEFAFEQESWAEVTDARGERLLFGLNAAGRTVRVRGAPPIAIVLGNANGVRLTVNGEPYEIPGAGREGALARFSVNPTEE
jgi:cytoskeleton protein RodZ